MYGANGRRPGQCAENQQPEHGPAGAVGQAYPSPGVDGSVAEGDDDDDETLRKRPAAQSESLDKGNTNQYGRTAG